MDCLWTSTPSWAPRRNAALPFGLTAAALLSWGAVVAVHDWRTRRIPNVLLLFALVPELTMLMWRGEGLLGQGPLSGLSGALLAAAVFLPGFLLGLSGGGDVKLAACCGLIVGMPGTLLVLLVASILLGVIAVGVLLLRRAGAGTSRRFAAGPALIAGFFVAVGLHLARTAL